jgi:hypothetical protein
LIVVQFIKNPAWPGFLFCGWRNTGACGGALLPADAVSGVYGVCGRIPAGAPAPLHGVARGRHAVFCGDQQAAVTTILAQAAMCGYNRRSLGM